MKEKAIRIVLISDNHLLKDCIGVIRDMYPDADYFFHCGDSEMPRYLLDGYACVQGNNDFYGEYPLNLTLEIGKHRFLLTHGHRDMLYGRYDMLVHKAEKLGCDVVCFGHTHRYFDETLDGVRLLNPGSVWHNRDGSEPSYMLLTLRGSEILVERKTYKVSP
ncbi:MAG: metallophosphoesterase [Solobacterium sp.]|nr:metallophosphoesterase [Solobacterium sp.]